MSSQPLKEEDPSPEDKAPAHTAVTNKLEYIKTLLYDRKKLENRIRKVDELLYEASKSLSSDEIRAVECMLKPLKNYAAPETGKTE